MGVKIYVLVHSEQGLLLTLARAIAQGAAEAGSECTLFRLPGDAPSDALASLPAITHDLLRSADAVLIGGPSRSGRMCSAVCDFLDGLATLQSTGALVGTVGSGFTSAGGGARGFGGHEAALQSLVSSFLHCGMIVVGVPPSALMDEAAGASPYGCCMSGATGTGGRLLTAAEEALAKQQGAFVAQTAARLQLADTVAALLVPGAAAAATAALPSPVLRAVTPVKAAAAAAQPKPKPKAKPPQPPTPKSKPPPQPRSSGYDESEFDVPEPAPEPDEAELADTGSVELPQGFKAPQKMSERRGSISANMESSSDLNAKLHDAAEVGDADIMVLLINAGADVNALAYHGETPLMAAVKRDCIDVVNLLLDRGALIDVANEDGSTAYHLCCAFGSLNSLQALVSCKCDTNLLDDEGLTGFTLAQSAGEDKVVAILSSMCIVD